MVFKQVDPNKCISDDVTLFPSVERDSPHPAALELRSLRGWLVLCVWLSDGDRAGNKLTCPFVVADTALWICSLYVGGCAPVCRGYGEEGARSRFITGRLALARWPDGESCVPA